MCKLNETKLEDLCVLNELENSILSCGKIELAENGLDPVEKDKARLEEFFKLQEKYTYGWYIAQQSLANQLKSINRFKEYIINFGGDEDDDSDVTKIIIKNDREKVIASFEVSSNYLFDIKEDQHEDCYVHHVVEDGKLGYVVCLSADTESLENISNELLLEELKMRLGE